MSDLVLTSDGSHTLRSDTFSELYHSHHGAITESKHVFLQAGLSYLHRRGWRDVTILEYGFGTGLNVALSWQLCEELACSVEYVCLEKYPVSLQEAESLNYEQLLDFPQFMDLHQCSWEKKVHLSKNFALTKVNVSFEEYAARQKFDLIYYDAFAPSVQPHLWLNPHLQHVVDQLSPDGILVTYCAKGTFKRALLELGLTVESLPGPPGKREITRAIKLD